MSRWTGAPAIDSGESRPSLTQSTLTVGVSSEAELTGDEAFPEISIKQRPLQLGLIFILVNFDPGGISRSFNQGHRRK
jgi:hypothetical protein